MRHSFVMFASFIVFVDFLGDVLLELTISNSFLAFE